MKRTSTLIILFHVLFWIYNVSRYFIFGRQMFREYTLDWLVIDQLILACIFYVHYLYALPYFLSKGNLKNFFLWLLCFIVSMTLVYGSWLNLSSTFFSIQQYEWDWGAIIDSSLLYAGLVTTFRFASDWLNNINTNQQLRLQKTSTEIQLMKSNVNIPFMLQTLSSMENLAKYSPKEVEAPVLHLSSVLRYGLYESQVSKINLNREFEILNEYVHLVNLNRKDIIFTLENRIVKMEEYSIPPNFIIKFVSFCLEYSNNFNSGTYTIVLENKGKAILLTMPTLYATEELLQRANLFIRSIGSKESGITIEVNNDYIILTINEAESENV